MIGEIAKCPDEPVTLTANNLFGGILLLSGSCIGVGMLALPVLTGFAGFLPTLATFFFCWLFMVTTAFLLVEANLWYKDKPNLITLSCNLLGTPGKICTWFSFLLLFYSLIVAYIVKGGDLTYQGLSAMFPYLEFPKWMGPVLLTFFSGAIIFFGTHIVDRFNQLCMFGLFLAYFFLLYTGIEHSRSQLLTYSNWSYSLFLIPFVVTSFGFHNMIPTLNDYFEGDRQKLMKTILIGGLVPFAVFLLWIMKIQSIIPLEGEISLSKSFQNGEISTETLSQFLRSSWVGTLANYFAFFAIVTSLFGQALSVFDFLSDGLKIRRDPKGRFLLTLLTFAPACVFAQLFPNIFFQVLEFVGGIAVMILFGLLPVAMIWIGRYRLQLGAQPIVPGGKIVLVIIAGIASSILTYEVIKHIG